MKKDKKRFLTILFIVVLLMVAGAGFYFFNNSSTKSNGLQVYFLKGDKPFPVRRPLDPGKEKVQEAAAQLMSGPSKEEKDKGIFSGMPARARIIEVKKQDSTVYVNFNQALEDYGGGAANVQALVGQIVYTFTDIPGVEKVKILVEGRGEVVLGGEGLVIDQPLSRSDL
ncbi:MAG: GerMN domain-containing protein [Candidatus Margulisiibacteriota bacterium]